MICRYCCKLTPYVVHMAHFGALCPACASAQPDTALLGGEGDGRNYNRRWLRRRNLGKLTCDGLPHPAMANATQAAYAPATVDARKAADESDVRDATANAGAHRV